MATFAIYGPTVTGVRVVEPASIPQEVMLNIYFNDGLSAYLVVQQEAVSKIVDALAEVDPRREQAHHVA